MQKNMNRGGVGPHVLAGAVAGFAAAWAMSEFQRSWVSLSKTKRKVRPRTDEEVMEEVVRRVSLAAGAPVLRKRDRERAGILLHYAFGIAGGALYGAAAWRSDLLTKGFGALFGSAFFAVGDVLAPRELKPLVNDNAVVSEIYEWLTHVIYGISLEGGRRGLTAFLSRVAGPIMRAASER
jgi:hypothetical protein